MVDVPLSEKFKRMRKDEHELFLKIYEEKFFERSFTSHLISFHAHYLLFLKVCPFTILPSKTIIAIMPCH